MGDGSSCADSSYSSIYWNSINANYPLNSQNYDSSYEHKQEALLPPLFEVSKLKLWTVIFPAFS